jgi:hypothetical protein
MQGSRIAVPTGIAQVRPHRGSAAGTHYNWILIAQGLLPSTGLSGVIGLVRRQTQSSGACRPRQVKI